MKKVLRITAILLIIALLTAAAGCGGSADHNSGEGPDIPAKPTPQGDSGEPSEEPEPEPEPEPPTPIEELVLASMSLDEKIGQLFLVDISALEKNSEYATSMSDAMRETLREYPAGGVIFFANNISSPSKLREFTEELKGMFDIPLFIAVDEEGGRVARLADTRSLDLPKYKSAAAAAAEGAEKVFEMYETIGTYLADYGFDLDFAPDADVLTNAANKVIGNRSFGSDPQFVSEMVSAGLDGLHEAGVLGCIKHFPGHGNTAGDTHSGTVKTQKTWEELLECDLVPFIGNLGKTDMIMAAHIIAPNVSEDGLPASLSKELITDRLRNELGYDGVVITDAMNMGAVAKNYTPEEAVIASIQAGVDIILMPADYKAAFNAIKDAVLAGEISEGRVDESVLRILRLKDLSGNVETVPGED